MNRYLANTLGVALLAVLGIVGWAAWRVGALAESVKVPDFTQSVTKLNAALDTVNRPCSPGPCGTLANVDKLTVKAGDVAVTTQRQVAQTGTLVTATAHDLATVGDSVRQVAAILSGTATAATSTIQQAQTDLQTANGTIASLQPLLGHADSTVADFDALLKNPAIPETMQNAEQITWNWNEISYDGKRLADDATKRYFTPAPWYRKALPYTEAGAKIAAYALPW